jgi:hypothetical protein
MLTEPIRVGICSSTTRFGWTARRRPTRDLFGREGDVHHVISDAPDVFADDVDIVLEQALAVDLDVAEPQHPVTLLVGQVVAVAGEACDEILEQSVVAVGGLSLRRRGIRTAHLQALDGADLVALGVEYPHSFTNPSHNFHGDVSFGCRGHSCDRATQLHATRHPAATSGPTDNSASVTVRLDGSA